jgi:hypothetical protein
MSQHSRWQRPHGRKEEDFGLDFRAPYPTPVPRCTGTAWQISDITFAGGFGHLQGTGRADLVSDDVRADGGFFRGEVRSTSVPQSRVGSLIRLRLQAVNRRHRRHSHSGRRQQRFLQADRSQFLPKSPQNNLPGKRNRIDRSKSSGPTEKNSQRLDTVLSIVEGVQNSS